MSTPAGPDRAGASGRRGCRAHHRPHQHLPPGRLISGRAMTPEARQRRRIRTPVLVVTAMAWAATLAIAAPRPGSGQHSMHGMDGMPGMAGMPAIDPGAGPPASTSWHRVQLGSPWSLLTGWPLMLTAMMAPLLIPALRHVYARSLPSSRRRSLTLLTAAYAATWTAGGLILQAVATALHPAPARARTRLGRGGDLAAVTGQAALPEPAFGASSDRRVRSTRRPRCAALR